MLCDQIKRKVSARAESSKSNDIAPFSWRQRKQSDKRDKRYVASKPATAAPPRHARSIVC